MNDKYADGRARARRGHARRPAGERGRCAGSARRGAVVGVDLPEDPLSRRASRRQGGLRRQDRPPGGRARLGGTPALVLLASLIVSLLAASSAPTPLYAIYQQRWGFSPITTTIVYGVYALTVLASLLTLGRLSDYVGRRPVLLDGPRRPGRRDGRVRDRGRGRRPADRPGHPGAVHRRGARRDRRGHAGHRHGARRARQRHVPRPRERQRRAALRAVRAVPARADPPGLPGAHRGHRRPGRGGRAAAGDRDREPRPGRRAGARGPAAQVGARPRPCRRACRIRRLGPRRPVRRARPRPGARADRVGERGARRRVADAADRDRGDLGLPAAQGAGAER